MTGRNPIADDLGKLHPESSANKDTKIDESKAVLEERLANSEKARKNITSKNKKDKFLLIFVAAVFFLLFVEKSENAPSCIIILTAIIAIFFLLWTKAKWSGFSPLAARLGLWLDLFYEIIKQKSRLKKLPESKKEYEDSLPPAADKGKES